VSVPNVRTDRFVGLSVSTTGASQLLATVPVGERWLIKGVVLFNASSGPLPIDLAIAPGGAGGLEFVRETVPGTTAARLDIYAVAQGTDTILLGAESVLQQGPWDIMIAGVRFPLV